MLCSIVSPGLFKWMKSRFCPHCLAKKRDAEERGRKIHLKFLCVLSQNISSSSPHSVDQHFLHFLPSDNQSILIGPSLWLVLFFRWRLCFLRTISIGASSFSDNHFYSVMVRKKFEFKRSRVQDNEEEEMIKESTVMVVYGGEDALMTFGR